MSDLLLLRVTPSMLTGYLVIRYRAVPVNMVTFATFEAVIHTFS